MRIQTTAANHPFAWLRPVLYPLVALLPAWLEADAEAANFSRGIDAAKKFGVHEIVLKSDTLSPSPFETNVTVTFKPPPQTHKPITVTAFHDGDRTWRARLYVSEKGMWSWSSHSTDDGSLHGRKGAFDVVQSNLRGKLRSHPKSRRWWATDDGRTFLNLSDTAYILFRSPSDPVQPVLDDTFRQYVEANVRLGITSMRRRSKSLAT